MKSTLMIKDLSVNKELDRLAMSAVRGGKQDTQVINQGMDASVTVGPTAFLNGGPASITVNSNPAQYASNYNSNDKYSGFGYWFPFYA